MLAKAAGFSIKDQVEKQRKGEVEREAYIKAYYRNQAFSPRHCLLQLISEHVTKFLAQQDDLGSDRQLSNDILNSIPNHEPAYTS